MSSAAVPLFKRIYRWLLPRALRECLARRRNDRLCSSLAFAKGSAWALPDVPAPAACEALPWGGGKGVNVVGYLRGQFGLGASARAYCQALMGVGYPVSLEDSRVAIPHANDDRSLEAHLVHQPGEFASTLVFVNPDHFEEAMAARTRVQPSQRVVACWFWELPRVPEAWRGAIEAVDEIIVATEFVADAFRAVTDKPVTRVPFPLLDAAPSGLSRTDFGLPNDAFVFLCTFDCNSTVARKNPDAVIAAFRAAFPPGRNDVMLLLKSSNGQRNPDALRKLLDLAAGDHRILLRDDVIDARHLQALQRECDAYVSLHRAEGLGLGMAECMRLGKPVIATGWSGNLDFMNAGNSLLVDYTLVPVQPGQYPHGEGQSWAEPDIEHAAALMRQVVDAPQSVVALIATAPGDIRNGMSPQHSGAMLAAYLESNPLLTVPSPPRWQGLSGVGTP